MSESAKSHEFNLLKQKMTEALVYYSADPQKLRSICIREICACLRSGWKWNDLEEAMEDIVSDFVVKM